MSKRELFINFRVSSAEYSAIAAAASELSLNVGTFAREVLLRKASEFTDITDGEDDMMALKVAIVTLEARVKALEAEVKLSEHD